MLHAFRTHRLRPAGARPQSTVMITRADWDLADQYFKDDADADYLQLQDSTFIKLNNKIYAYDKNPRNLLGTGGAENGEGRQSIVRKAIDRNSHEWALKIESLPIAENTNVVDEHREQLRKENQILAQLQRPLYHTIERAPNPQDAKQYHQFYGILPLKKGRDLDFVLAMAQCNNTPITRQQALTIGLKCCEEIQSMHEKSVAHRDIQDKNFMIDGDLDNPHIAVIDFGRSEIVPPNALNRPGNRGPIPQTSMDPMQKDVDQLRRMLISKLGLTCLRKRGMYVPSDVKLLNVMTILRAEMAKLNNPVPRQSSAGNRNVRVTTAFFEEIINNTTGTKRGLSDDDAAGPTPGKRRRTGCNG